MNRLTATALSAGAFATAGVAATVVNRRFTQQRRRRRRGEAVEFGSVHGERHTVVVADGTPINLEIDEAADPDSDVTVVFVHGWMCDLDSWHYQRLALRDKVRMIAVDQRGHGASGRTGRANSSLALMADDLRAVIQQHGNGRVLLVGHSMGGMAVMQLAADAPELFDEVVGVVLISTSAGRLMRGRSVLERIAPVVRRAAPMLDWARSVNSYSVVRQWAVGPNAAERHADMAHEMILRAPSRVIVDFYDNFTELDLFDALPTLEHIPAVVVCGSEDLLTAPKHSRRLAEAIDGAELVMIEGAGHMVMFEAHEEVSRVIEDLLEATAP